MYKLRDYQENSIEAVRVALRGGKKKPLLVLPTGGGKTVCFSSIAFNASQRGNKVMIIVHRQELIYQTSEKLSAWGIDHGIISPEFQHTDQGVQVAMIQTLTRRLLKTEKPDLLIIDEAHHSNAANYKRVIEWAGCTTIGVTATPCRLDGRGLGEVYDEICVGVTVQELIDRGFLSEYKYYALPIPKDAKREGLRKLGGEYTSESATKLIEGAIPNIVGEWESKAKGLPTIVFCPSVATAESVAKMFTDAGHKFVPISGAMDRTYRKQVISSLASGEVHGITSCDVVSEGTDIPVASCAMLLRKTASTSLYLQQVGRVLRPVEGKTAIVIDFVENYKDHGAPCSIRAWELGGRVKKPVNMECLCSECSAVNSKLKTRCVECGAILNYKECPECMGMVPSFEKKCECGYVFERKAKELIQSGSFTLAEVEFVDKKLKKQFMKPFREFLEKAMGWNPNAAYYKWKIIEDLGESPEKATPDKWQKVYTTHGDSKYDFDSFVSYNKKLFKEFDKWQKLAKA